MQYSGIKKAFKTLAPLAVFLAAWSFLNVLMNFSYPEGQNEFRNLLVISPEVFIILVLLCLGAFLGMPFHRAVFIPLTLALICLRLFRIADILVPAYFFRPFNLYLDSQFLPDLIFLLYSTLPLQVFALWSFLAVVAPALIAWGIWRALKSITTFFSGRRQRRIFSVAAVIIGVLMVSLNPGTTGHAGSIFAPGILQRVAAEIDFILHLSNTIEKHQAVRRHYTPEKLVLVFAGIHSEGDFNCHVYANREASDLLLQSGKVELLRLTGHRQKKPAEQDGDRRENSKSVMQTLLIAHRGILPPGG